MVRIKNVRFIRDKDTENRGGESYQRRVKGYESLIKAIKEIPSHLGALLFSCRKAYIVALFFFIPFSILPINLCGQTESGARVCTIDWVRMEVSVVGEGSIIVKENGNPIEWQYDAVLKAQKDILKNYLSCMKLVLVDAYTSGWSLLERNPQKNESIYSYIQDYKPYSVRYKEDKVTVSKTIPLFGNRGLAKLLVAPGTDTGNFSTYDTYVYSTSFTGLVVDARGLDRVPALAPKIYDEDHNVVYSADLVKKESFERWGALQYTGDPHYREFEERVGAHPYRVVAIKDEKLIRTDIALSNGDAVVLLQHEETRRSLEEGRVVVIIDQEVIESCSYDE